MKHAFIALTLTLVACSSGTDDPLGTSRSGLDSPLVEGQECPPEKCADEAIATPADGTPPDPNDYHCVAGPQQGSGVGVCRLEAKK